MNSWSQTQAHIQHALTHSNAHTPHFPPLPNTDESSKHEGFQIYSISVHVSVYHDTPQMHIPLPTPQPHTQRWTDESSRHESSEI